MKKKETEQETVIKMIEELLGIKINQIKDKDGEYSDKLSDILSAIANKERELRELEPKHLLGDVKWILYQYVIKLNDENSMYTFRCGNFAYNKIAKLSDFKADGDGLLCGELNLNGERVFVIRVWDIPFDKKKIIISKGCIYSSLPNNEELKESFPSDIVLYFA